MLWFAEYNNDSVVRMTTWGSLLSRTSLSSGSHPLALAVAADGNSVWATENGSNKIAEFSMSGALLGEVAVATGSKPDDIAAGTDDNMYFTEDVGNGVQSYIGKVTQARSISYAAAPAVGPTSGMASVPDGNIWFMENQYPAIVRYDLSTGVMTQHPIEGYGNPQGLVAGADGQFWFVTNPGGYIVSYHP